MVKNGIDVSAYQGDIDWSAVSASGVEFAILRAGYGDEASQKDAQFDANYAGCKASGVPCGAYWFSYALSPEEARREAEACLTVLNGTQLAYPVFLDMEEESQRILGAEACSAIAEAFLSTVEGAGYFVGIYSDASFLEENISEAIRQRYTVWVAEYDVDKPTYSDNFGIWQKSDQGSIPGISGNVDLDECYEDYPAAIKANGLNGFKKSPEKSLQELAQEVLKGEWGNGQERKDRLTAAGYDYAAVQALVNQLVSERTYTVAPGDTLTAIARKFGTTVQAILQANQKKYPSMTADYIQAGWILQV